jgi:type IV pilus assembly protein PilO
MALLPQEPRQQRALVTGLLVGGLFYAFHEYMYTPRNEDLALDQERLERLETQNLAAEVRALQRERLQQQAAVYERYVRRLEQLVPAEEEVPALLRDITAEARRLNVDLNLIEPTTNEQGAYYTREVYTMRVIGEYHDVGRFLTTIASLPRIITPAEVAMTTLQADGIYDYDAGVMVDFQIETYVLPAGGPQMTGAGTMKATGDEQ